MKEKKYTKGPWGIEQTEDYNWIGPMRRSGDGKLNDIVTKTERGKALKLECLEESDANAQLIAAAPELLEACEEAREAMNLWALTYAPEFCDEEAVKAAHTRISELGGTLALIANTGEKLRSAISKAIKRE